MTAWVLVNETQVTAAQARAIAVKLTAAADSADWLQANASKLYT